MDLFTTFSKIAGIELPNDRELDGYDLSDVLFKRRKGPRNEVLYYREQELYAVRIGAFKAHFITKGGYGNGEKVYHKDPLLFNVDQDPGERFNIAEQHPDIVAQITRFAIQFDGKLSRMPDVLQHIERAK